MVRKAKEVKAVKEVEEVEAEVVAVPVAEPVKVGFDIQRLKALVWNSKLEDIQEAVAEIKDADAGTMNAVNNVLASKSTGIASQFLQQIIQRNS